MRQLHGFKCIAWNEETCTVHIVVFANRLFTEILQCTAVIEIDDARM